MNNPVNNVDESGYTAIEIYLIVKGIGVAVTVITTFAITINQRRNIINSLKSLGVDTAKNIRFVTQLYSKKISLSAAKNKKNGKTRKNKRATEKEATKIGKSKGYVDTNRTSQGRKVYYNPKNNTYIAYDQSGHSIGVWKMAKTVEGLFSKDTRMGTYDEFFNKIGD